MCILSLSVSKLSINDTDTSYDVMGDMVFGGGFETMRDGAKNSVIMHVIESGLK